MSASVRIAASGPAVCYHGLFRLVFLVCTMPADSSTHLAIVTGAAGGLGRAFCRQVIARPGRWHLVAVDIDEAGASEAATAAAESGRATAEAACFDVADAQAWLDLRQRLRRTWPRLALVVNNAGVCMSAEVGDGELADWRRVQEVNYTGVLNGCHVMTPWLKESAAASGVGSPRTPSWRPAVINVASIMGLVPAPSLAAYSASKAAVVALSETMYAELRPRGVRVAVVAPGFFRTGLLDRGTFASQLHRDEAERLVQTSTIDADSVAHSALTACERGRLYAVVGRRARWYWRLKRAVPTTLVRSLATRYARMMRGD